MNNATLIALTVNRKQFQHCEFGAVVKNLYEVNVFYVRVRVQSFAHVSVQKKKTNDRFFTFFY